MGCIEPKFNVNEVMAKLGRLAEVVPQAVAEAFQLTCTEIVSEARQLNTYQDQTSNLRSSIGYGIYIDGEPFTEDYRQAGNGTGDGSLGQGSARATVEEVAARYPEGIVGVIVAGMEYALYVESKGYDVLTGPANHAQEILDRNIKIVMEELIAAAANG